jgi:hypothetical protein
MKLTYVPLLRIQRELHGIPRAMERFKAYLNTISAKDGATLELPSLVTMNPLGKEHMTALLDTLIALNADEIAAQAVQEASAQLTSEPSDCRVALVVADDLKGGWTNRYANEFTLRFPCGATNKPKIHVEAEAPLYQRLPRWLKHFWITAVVWSSETPTEKSVREAVLTAVYRQTYMQKHGLPRNLHDMLAQEGAVMARAGCTTPCLDDEDIAYTREVLTPFLDANDMRTAIECLFGDAAGRTLGFTPRGLSPWAGVALALHDAKNALTTAST